MVQAQLFVEHDDVFTEDVTVNLERFSYLGVNNYTAEDLSDVAVIDFSLLSNTGEVLVLRGQQHTFNDKTGAGDYSVEDFGTTLLFDVPASAVLKKVTVNATN